MQINARGQFVHVPIKDRFWDKVNKNGPLHPTKPELGNCWLWTGVKAHYGYGVIWTQDHGQRLRAHRIAWELVNKKKIPSKKHLLHSCDRPACVNPSHTYPGTDRDNHRDRLARGRTLAGERNPAAYLTTAQVLDIRKHFPLRRGKTGPRTSDDRKVITRLLEKHAISAKLLTRIAYGYRWKHLFTE